MAERKENVEDSKAMQIINQLLNQLSPNDECKCYHNATNLTPLPDVQVLSERVICVLGQNPSSMTLQGTNTYIIGTGKRRFIIDTGEGVASYIKILKQAMKDSDTESIKGIICTHWHYDHIKGIASIRKEFGSDIPIYKYWSDSMESKLGVKFINVLDKQIFKCEGATLIAHYTPGHCDDHIALELVEENSIFCGDCILGEGSTVFNNLYLYMLSLKQLLTFKCDAMYPGHGPMIKDAQNKINQYINHRNNREIQILNALKQKQKEMNKSIDSWTICDIVYDKTPQNLKRHAHHNLIHHLHKLVMEKRVKENDDKTYLFVQ